LVGPEVEVFEQLMDL